MANPLPPPGQALPRKGSCPGGRPYGLAAKEGNSVRRQSPNARLEVSNAALNGGASFCKGRGGGI